MLCPHSSMKIQCRTILFAINQFGYSIRFWITSGQFLSAGSGLANFTRQSIPSRAPATVRSWTVGFLGKRCRSSWFISFRVRRRYSLMMLFKHYLISLSTRTLFGQPHGISSILPFLTYRATMFLAVDLFIPKASATIRKSSCGFSKALTTLWRCSKRILFLLFISAITILTGQIDILDIFP